jgi:hypothetical protein
MNAWETVLGNDELAESWNDLRGEAVSRGEQLLEEAKRHGAALLALAANRGIRLAQEYGGTLIAPRRRRRRSAWKWILAAAVVAVIAAGVASRD